MLDNIIIDIFSRFIILKNGIANIIYILGSTFYTALLHNSMDYASSIVDDRSVTRRVQMLSMPRYNLKSRFIDFKRILISINIPLTDTDRTLDIG